MLKQFNLCNLFLLAFIVYFAQGTFYANGSIISQTMLIVFLLISVYCGIRVLEERGKPFFIWALYLFLGMYLIGTVWVYAGDLSSARSGTSNPLDILKSILIALTPFFAGYYFSKKGQLGEKAILIFFLFLIIDSIFGFYFNNEKVLSRYSTVREEITNNGAYNFVGLLLFIPLLSKRIYWGYAGMGVLFYYIMIGAKRGAIIIGFLLLILNTFYLLKSSGKDVKKIIRNFFIGLVGLVAVGLIAYFVFQDSTYLQKRLEETLEGNSSGRDRIYSAILYAWYESDSILSYLFGLGYLSSIRIAGNYAHNDWLELLSSFGLCGVFVYILFFVGLFKIALNRNYTFEQRYIIFMFTIYLGLKSLISMGFMAAFPTGIGLIFVGYILGKGRKSNLYYENYQKNISNFN